MSTAPTDARPSSGSPPAPPPSAKPGAKPPPYMYQEPWTPPPGERPPSDPSGEVLEPQVPRRPPPYPAPYPQEYVYEPPPPAPILHRSPYNSLWVGARVGAIFPFGSAYNVRDGVGYFYPERWEGMASSGLLVEGDVGARFGRNYIVYAFWEHGRLGTGSDPTWRTGTVTVPPDPADPGFGDQTSATTDYPGLGFRWTSRPDRTGLVVDLGLGYRWFRERWADGTKIDLQGFGEFRVGFGADVRVNRAFSISPLLAFTSGSFSEREITDPGAPRARPILGTYAGSHGTLTLTVGGHFDFGF
ncbi:MAG TPA: hypothetical protein VJT73_01045 [Polyangiaceae bacterium]|nr:hypothetical protein [Polyangiaceae bacterium]